MPTDAELMAEWQSSQTPAQEEPVTLLSPAANDLLAVGNRAVEGMGSSLDFWEATERNLNPFRYGGPRLFGLNDNLFNVPPAEPLSEGLKDVAESVYLYGPEKAQTDIGKFLEPGAELLGSMVGPGATSVAKKPLLAAATLGGVLNLAGTDEKTRKIAEATTLVGPGVVKGAAQALTTGVGAIQKALGYARGIDDAAASTGKALSRSAFGVRASDYGKDIEELGPWTLDVPAGQIESKIKANLDDLIKSDAFKGNYSPKNIVRTGIAEREKLIQEIGSVVDEADRALPMGIEPSFTRAEKYISDGKISNPRWARAEINRYRRNIAEEGFGSLKYIQQQKIAAGDTYEVGQAAKNGLYRAIYHDLQKTVEKYAPQVAPLNKELGKWEQLTPIFARQLGNDEKKDIITSLMGALRTSGGTLTTPSLLMGTALGTAVGPAAILPGVALTAAATRPGRLAIGKSLAELGKAPSLPKNFPAGVANMLGDSTAESTSSPSDEQLLKEWASVTKSSGQSLRSELGNTEPRERQELPQQSGNAQRGREQETRLSKQSLQGQAISSSNYNPVSDSYAIPHILNVPEVLSAKRKENMNDAKPETVKQVEQAIDANPYYSALYEAESGRNPNAKNPKSSAEGGFQFIKATAKAMGLDDPKDLGKSFEAIQRLTNDHIEKFGDDPARLYAAHVLGATVLNKWLDGKYLSPKEQAQVRQFKSLELPRFLKIYEKVNQIKV